MKVAFAFLALLILGSAGVALTRRNLIHSALLLIGAWFGIAGYYLWSGAEFVAFAQVLVYGGAVSMVVLFAVLLTRHAYPDPAEPGETLRRAASAVLVALAVFLLLAKAGRAAIRQLGWSGHFPRHDPFTVRQIGLELMGPEAAALLAVGLLLTVALIGAVVLAGGAGPRNGKDPS